LDGRTIFIREVSHTIFYNFIRMRIQLAGEAKARVESRELGAVGQGHCQSRREMTSGEEVINQENKYLLGIYHFL
jgi:hypothetical protein